MAQIDNANGKIALLKPTCRLLSLFIRHNNVLLLRERLLNEVWVEHGLKASNNNLNNYVSGLRKSLAQFGEEELIVTYPRQGFKFTAEIIHEVNKSNELDKEARETAGQEITESTEGRAIWRPLQRLIMVLAACLVPFAAIVLYQNSNRINVYPLGSYQQCQIYSMHLDSGNLNNIKEMIQRSGLSCQSRADVYYYGSVRNEYSLNDEVQLTYCPREINSPCINNYIDNSQE
ncbi:winged helix-turn-helix domain-containing protein [Serratia marcescens]|uniref:winged helix-turn-helix domain-containing protein n=1 Tax=Serratia marcescens TaxID=615 RepID=UPI00214B55E3|nr:winged helix-turn-helix domain-containing protein [Serratia marcescens]